ncbi:PucR family transcriptional regulator [Terrilactibacillus laevilacticus]|uniref:PucR family transcriptional regulator n=1 Tax=Terrilactibacillus laevilacticus TaxID=1380157 RepID=UPI001146C8F6|nr:PucR family transcriptional regulator [Terrilactibacillus laevilacticus]
MNVDVNLTVKAALNRPCFSKAKLVTSKNGLYRRIRWAHVLETLDMDQLINGEELILTTGVGLNKDSERLDFLRTLIQHGASCLCIELGPSFPRVSEDLISIALEHDFPIIVFEERVKFIEITQDLHTFLINTHYRTLQQLELISKEFHQLTLSSTAGLYNILKLLQKQLNHQIFYLPYEGRETSIPLLKQSVCQKMTEQIGKQIAVSTNRQKLKRGEPIIWSEDKNTFVLQAIVAMGQTWAYLCMNVGHQKPSEFDTLVMGRAVLCIAQENIRIKYVEEKQMHHEQLWIKDLIHERPIDQKQMKARLGLDIKGCVRFRVCVIEMVDLKKGKVMEEEESLRIYISLLTRTIFEENGFQLLITTENNQIIAIVMTKDSNSDLKHHLKNTLDQIKERFLHKRRDKTTLIIGIGRERHQLLDSHLGFKESQIVINMEKLKLREETLEHSYFYDDIGVARLLFMMQGEHKMDSFINDYIGAILAYDEEKGSNLLQTLKVYLDCGGSKQEAAKRLYVVRQTLYHRLQKIEELLGGDFMNTERRLSIEFAIRAHLLSQVMARIN